MTNLTKDAANQWRKVSLGLWTFLTALGPVMRKVIVVRLEQQARRRDGDRRQPRWLRRHSGLYATRVLLNGKEQPSGGVLHLSCHGRPSVSPGLCPREFFQVAVQSCERPGFTSRTSHAPRHSQRPRHSSQRWTTYSASRCSAEPTTPPLNPSTHVATSMFMFFFFK